MSLGSWIKTKAQNFVMRALSLTSRAGWETEGSDSGETVSQDSVLSLSTAWACINLHAGVLGTLPLHVYRRNPRTGFPEIAAGHWLEQLFDIPNVDQTSVDFLEFMAASLEMRGNFYAEKRRLSPNLPIIALEPIRPDFMEVTRSRETGRLVYKFSDANGVQQTRDQDEIWHVRGFGGGPLGGLSPMSFGRHAFGLALAQEKTAATMFKNGIRPAGVLKFKDWLKPDKREAAHSKLIADHAGAINQGKPLVLEGGVEWQQIQFSPADSEMLQSRAFSVEDICRWFGVPPVLIGHTEKVSSWGTGVAEITLGFVKYALRRRVKRVEKSAAMQLLSAKERGEGYFVRFDLEGLLRGDPKARAAFYQIMTQIGAKTINEVRALENDPPIPGGDVPRLQAQNVPLTAVTGQVMLSAPSSGD